VQNMPKVGIKGTGTASVFTGQLIILLSLVLLFSFHLLVIN